MNAPKLIRECPLKSAELVGDVKEFFCTVCKKDITNLSLIGQREGEERVRASNSAESCGMWLEDREGNLVNGRRALEIFKRMVAAGALAASIPSGTALFAGEPEKENVGKEETKCGNHEEKVSGQGKSDSSSEEEIIFTVGFYVEASDVAYSPIDGKRVSLPKNPKALRFHKKR